MAGKTKMIKFPAASSEDDYQLQSDLRCFIDYTKMCKEKGRLEKVKALAKKMRDENNSVIASIDKELSENESGE